LRRIEAVCAVLCLANSFATLRVAAQAPSDVPQGHWAYAAVEDLASKGLIKGYPPSGDFFGKRTVTRYEMATIVQRVLARVDDLLAKKADKGAEPQAVSPAQLDEVRKLVADFKVELAVIGTDLQKVKDQIGELNEKVGAARQTADAAKAAAEKAAADAASAQRAADQAKQGVQGTIDALSEQRTRIDAVTKTVSQHKISGYIQTRFESYDTGRTSLFSPTGAGGTGQSPSIGGPAVGGPYYGFLARRVRLKVSGPIGSAGKADYGVQIDAPSFTAVNTKEAYTNIRDLVAKNTAFTLGQFAPPFGWEVPTSSATREAPERSLGFSDTTASSAVFKSSVSATGGVVTPGSVLPLFINQEFDQGAMFSWGPRGTFMPGNIGTQVYLMALNGGGTVPAGIRNMKNGIDWILRGQTTVLGRLDVGVSGYYGQIPVRATPPVGGVVAPFVNGLKELAGVDLNYRSPWKTTFRAEYVGGVYEVTPDRALYLQNNHAQAWYLSLRHPITPKLEAALKYDEFMPISQLGKFAGGFGRMDYIRKTLQGGLLYSIDEATRLRLWYAKGLTPYDPTAPSGPLRTRLGLLTGEVQIRF